MFKVTYTRHYHGHPMLIAIVYRLVVPDGTSRLYNRRNAGFVRDLHTIPERKISIGGHYRTIQAETERTGFLQSLTQRIDPRCLPDPAGQ